MDKQNVIAIFDVGKTNKKLFLFDENYNILSEESTRLENIKDEDGFECENVEALTKWINTKFEEISSSDAFNLVAINFSGYGASMVNINDIGEPITPLYSYLKPFPQKLKENFYSTYGGESLVSKQTASPVLGSLNSGLQLYRLKYEQPEIFSKLKYALHLPQYLSFIISSVMASDITSIGSHTHLWDFEKNKYHHWVFAEGLQNKLAPIYTIDKTVDVVNGMNKMQIGIGLHDSSAALIPYLKLFPEPFILLSTGTWCISLNPFNHSMLTDYELQNDCLCYLTYEGKPVKASRLFAGYEHEEQIKKLADHFNKEVNYYTQVGYNPSWIKSFQEIDIQETGGSTAMIQQSMFEKRSLIDFQSYEEAYHQLMLDIVTQQYYSTQLVLKGTDVKRIFVDGGFGKNEIYMNLLADVFPSIEVFAASMPQATALGAALSMHISWNKNSLPNSIIELKYFSPAHNHVS
jgi:sugar (pentulose or hexulose) kinase